MLHKSFKPAKCKTSLKLATSRIKLMKNKKGVQMNQMKRELAQLLESGQDRTARIRVEHLIREEKMVAAYDLIEIYCELIAARLPIIESQKNCPIDLKEAITSVIFASPRCADIPELLDVKKHFTAKYGKEFVTSALELRPNCGVGRMLVEKLSAIAPDGQTKVKVLNAIAEEHNIKWDSQSFEEKDSKPADDLLNGPSTFEKASELHAETPKIQVPNVQATSSHDEHVRPSNFTEENTRSSLNNQIFSSTEPGSIKTTTTTNHPGFKSSGKGDERMKVRHSFSGDDDAFSSGRQNWNMEFKDATSAAQAAAESAERASMAARAAAELSSREHITRQYSSESHKSINDSIRHKRPGTSKFPGEHFASVPVNNSFHDRNSKLQNEQIGSDEHHNLAGDGERFGDDHGNTKRLGSSHSASLRSRKASVDDDTFVNSVQKPDGYSEKSLYKETIKADKEPLYSKMDTKKQSVDPRIENVSRWQDDFKSENVDQFGEARLKKQHSTSSSRSHSSTNSDDYNVSNNYHQKFGNDDSEDPFVGNDHESIHIDTAKMGSYDDSVAYDEYDFDDIGPKYDEGESSLGRNSPTSPTTTVDTWNPRRNTIKSPEKSTSQPHFSAEHHSLFSESLANSVDPSESDNVPVIPYEFDGPKFDSEDEQEKTSHGGIIDSSIFSHKQNVFSLDPEPAQDENYGLTGSSFEKRNSGSDKRSRFGSSSSDDLDNVEVHLKSDQVTVLNVESQKKFDSGESPANYLSPRFSKSQLELNDIGSKSSIAADEWNVRESSRLSFAHVDKDNVHSRDTLKDDELLDQSSTQGENKLSFGTLRGGFRNKGYRHPPYNRKPSGDDASSLTQKAAVESSTLIEQQVASPPSVRSSINSSMSNNADKNSSFSTSVARSDSDSDSDSDNDNLGEEVSQKTTSRRQASYAQKSSKRLNMKSSFRPPVATYFDLDNDNDDSKEDIPKQTLPNKSHLGSGISRRTKAYPPSTETSSYSKVQAGSEASVSPNFINERKPTRSHHGAETPIKSRFQTRSSGHVDSEEQPSSAEKAASKAMTVSKISSREENLNSSAVEKPSSPMRNTRPSGNLQNSKTSTPKAEPPTREDSAKRASHVHPKLPDYDSIAAQLQSLRKDRQ